MDLSSIDLGPKMQACSERERKFAYAMATGMADNATEAARLAGYPDNKTGGIQVRAHELIHRERVIAAIEEIARKEFRGFVVPALMAARRLILNDKHPDHAKAVNSMLSRLGFGERTGVDVNVNGDVQINHTDAAVENLRMLLALGFPRERLVETFGESGLDRYMKMLNSKPKVIEGVVAAPTGHDPPKEATK